MRHVLVVLLACSHARPVSPPIVHGTATTPCRFASPELEGVEDQLRAAIAAHRPMAGTCLIRPGARRKTYEVRDGQRIVVVLTQCGANLLAPGITIDGVGVGMTTAEAERRLHAELICEEPEEGVVICRSSTDDEMHPSVSYFVGDDRVTIVLMRSGPRCIEQ